MDERPAHLAVAEQGPMGLETANRYIVPPRLKIVQKAAGSDILDNFEVGDLIISPQMMRLAAVNKNAQGKPDKTGELFAFTPLFFFPEWFIVNPIETKGQLPMIRNRTVDPQDEIAIKARDSRLWFEKCPEMPEKNMRYVESLNFLSVLVLPDDHPLNGMPVNIGFSKGSHKSGSMFLSYLQLRKADIFGNVFQARTQFAVNPKNQEYYKLDVMQGVTGMSQWVTDSKLYDKYRELHMQLKQAHADKLIQTVLDEDEVRPEGQSSEY